MSNIKHVPVIKYKDAVHKNVRLTSIGDDKYAAPGGKIIHGFTNARNEARRIHNCSKRSY